MIPRLFIFITSFLLAPLSYAVNIYVAPVKGTNVDSGQLKTVHELIKVQVRTSPHHDVVNQENEADFFIQTHLIKLETYSLSMTRWQGKQKIMQGQWTASSLAELESTIRVATQETLHSTSNAQDAVLFDNNKTMQQQAEDKKLKGSFERVEAVRQVSLGFGPSYFSNMNSPDQAIGFLVGYTWNIDQHFDLGLRSNFSISTLHSDAYLLGAQINTQYFFASRDISPYLGAGFGYGWASAHNGPSPLADDTSGGFALSVGGGVKFFRTSTVSFSVGAELMTLFDRNSLGAPSVFSIQVAFHY